jgi:hypothetical protein
VVRGLREGWPGPEDARSRPQGASGAGRAGWGYAGRHRTELAADERSAAGPSWLISWQGSLAR